MARSSPRLTTLSGRVHVGGHTTASALPKQRDSFYVTPEWKKLIASIVAKRGRRCEKCGKTHDADGKSIRIYGDHTRELADGGAPLDANNIAILCGSCHTIKTNEARAKRTAKIW